MPDSISSSCSTHCGSWGSDDSLVRIGSFNEMIRMIENNEGIHSPLYLGWYSGPRFLYGEFTEYLFDALVAIDADKEHIEFFRNIENCPSWFEWTVPRVRLARENFLWLASKLDSLTVPKDLYYAIQDMFEITFKPEVTAILASSLRSPRLTYSGRPQVPPSFINWLKKISDHPRFVSKPRINSIVRRAFASAHVDDLLEAIRNESEGPCWLLHDSVISPDLISFADTRSYSLCYNRTPRAVLFMYKVFRDGYPEFERDDRRLASERIVKNNSRLWRDLNRIVLLYEPFKLEWCGTIGRFLANLYKANRDSKQHKDCYMNCLFSRIDAEDIIKKMDRGGLDCRALYDVFRHIDVEIIIDIYTSVTDAITNGDLKFPTNKLEASVCCFIMMRRAISSPTVSLLRAEAAEATG